MDNLAQIMPLRFRDKLAPVLKNPVIEEIRIRVGQPIELRCREENLSKENAQNPRPPPPN